MLRWGCPFRRKPWRSEVPVGTARPQGQLRSHRERRDPGLYVCPWGCGGGAGACPRARAGWQAPSWSPSAVEHVCIDQTGKQGCSGWRPAPRGTSPSLRLPGAWRCGFLLPLGVTTMKSWSEASEIRRSAKVTS